MLETYYKTDFHSQLFTAVERYGGFVNAHAHLDRAQTLNAQYLSHAGINVFEGAALPLRVKQNLAAELHRGPAYDPQDLYRRMGGVLVAMRRNGVRKAISFIDVTPDIGLIAFDQALKLKVKFAEKRNQHPKLDFEIALSPIFGFRDPAAWELYQRAAPKADILGGLPEKDYPVSAGGIGFEEHIRRILELGIMLHKEVHFHVDQANDPSECGTETLVELVRQFGSPSIEGTASEPTVWAVHVISPSSFSQKRFARLLEDLRERNIGVICCPTAAISMRQLRPIRAPTHNSIARVLEMLEVGVRVRIGTDNIADVFVPNGDGSMMTEVNQLASAIRFYHPRILAKIAADVPLDDADREIISRHLAEDKKAWALLRNRKN